MKERLGQGSFGDVYTVDYKGPGKVIQTGCEESVGGSGPKGEETFLQRSSSSQQTELPQYSENERCVPKSSRDYARKLLF